jgi:TonB family protein
MLILLAAMAAPTFQPLRMVKPVFREQWIAASDYPASARRFGYQGTVGFRLKVHEQGWPTDCMITESSKSQVLDAETCRLLSLRARFEPARDGRGKPMPSSYESRIVWKMPRAFTAPAPGMVVTTLNLSKQGEVEDCSIDSFGGAPKGMGKMVCQNMAQPFPAAFLKQHAVSYRAIRFATSISIGDAGFPLEGRDWGTLLIKNGLELELDRQDRPIRCTAAPFIGQQPAGDPCAAFRRMLIAPESHGEKADRVVRFENGVFGQPR